MISNRTTSGNPSAVSVQSALDRIERRMDRLADAAAEDSFAELTEDLRALHAQLQSNHAAKYLGDTFVDMERAAPEMVETLRRLRDEHAALIGQLDRTIRAADAAAAGLPEDQVVFMLRVREITAIARRRDAEEDRLLHVAMWRDTGGEGG